MVILLDLTVSNSLLQLALILFSAKLMGVVFDYFKQPKILGELSAGLILGVSFLNVIDLTNETVLFIAEIGILMLFFDLGMRSHARELLKSGFNSFIVAALAIISTTFLIVVFLMMNKFSFGTSLFVGMLLTATSIGITTKTLIDVGKLKTKEGITILIAAMIVDVIALIFISVAANSAHEIVFDAFEITKMMIYFFAFIVLVIILGKVMRKFISLKESRNFKSTYVVSTFVFAVLISFIAKEIGLLAIMGAFAAGLVLEKGEKIEFVSEKTRVLTDLFTPVFYVVAGAAVSLQSILIPEITPLVIALTILVIIGKLISGYGVWNLKTSKFAVASGMIAGGGVGLTFAAFGLRKEILAPEFYSAIVVVLVITTFLGPILMKKAFEKVS